MNKYVVRQWLRDLRRFFFPEVCPVCGRRLEVFEQYVCTDCEESLPRANLHLPPTDDFIYMLAVTAHIRKVASMFIYKKDSPYANLIREGKYYNRPQLLAKLTKRFASELLPCGFFADINAIVPVPVYHTKELKRGYNQAKVIADAVGEITGIPVVDNLIAVKDHKSQTKKSGAQRALFPEGVYAVDEPAMLAGKHLLLVDDVITTGATLTACAKTLCHAVPQVSLSAFSLAFRRSL